MQLIAGLAFARRHTPVNCVTDVAYDEVMSSSAADIQRAFWNRDANRYHAAHPDYVSSFYWCPEMLHEKDARLLGDVTGTRVLELGCGSAPCTRWLSQFAELAVGFDVSESMLRALPEHGDLNLVQADACALPFGDRSFDVVFSAFGAIPFIKDITTVFHEVHRVLRGDRFVFSVTHPMRWIFRDDPESLEVAYSYFEPGYEERDDTGKITYAEYHHTLSDYVAALSAAGFYIDSLIEPQWPAALTTTWGQWSPLRGQYFPGTLIVSARLHPSSRRRPPTPRGEQTR